MSHLGFSRPYKSGFHSYGKFSVIISNISSTSFILNLSIPSWTPIKWMLEFLLLNVISLNCFLTFSIFLFLYHTALWISPSYIFSSSLILSSSITNLFFSLFFEYVDLVIKQILFYFKKFYFTCLICLLIFIVIFLFSNWF